MMRRIIAALAALLMYAGAALAQERTLTMSDPTDDVLVLRDSKAMDEFYDLVNANNLGDTELLAPLLACVVSSGTKAIVADGGYLSSTVLVTDGAEKGCRGEQLRKRRSSSLVDLNPKRKMGIPFRTKLLANFT
jgi:hypothetical protein